MMDVKVKDHALKLLFTKAKIFFPRFGKILHETLVTSRDVFWLGSTDSLRFERSELFVGVVWLVKVLGLNCSEGAQQIPRLFKKAHFWLYFSKLSIWDEFFKKK